MGKGGQSEIITTVLIILLVLAVVFIVFIVVRNMISRGTESMGVETLTVNLKIDRQNSLINKTGVQRITIQRAGGAGELSGVNIVFNGNTQSYSYQNKTSISELESRTFIVDLSDKGIGELKSVGIYPIVKLGSGKEVYGPLQEEISVTASSETSISNECARESDSAFCLRLGKNCTFTGNDNCGNLRTANCGTCQSGQTCSNGVCITAPVCYRLTCSGAACLTDNYCQIINSAVSYWKFEESSWIAGRAGEVKDYFGRNNGTSWNVRIVSNGVMGKAAEFNKLDSDYIEVPFNSNLNTPNFTISLWAKMEDYPSNYESIITSRDDGVRRGYIIYDFSNGIYAWSFWIGRNTAWAQLSSEGFVDFEIQNWTHIAGTYNGSQMSLYLNGEKIGTDSYIDFYPNLNKPLRIGAGTTEKEPLLFFNGQVDEVIYFNRSLSPEEILTIYNSQKP